MRQLVIIPAAIAIATLAACTPAPGPQGPPGPAGEAGPAGPVSAGWFCLREWCDRRSEVHGARHGSNPVYVCAGEFSVGIFGRFDPNRPNGSAQARAAFARPLTYIPKFGHPNRPQRSQISSS
jgi:hypothetical protein